MTLVRRPSPFGELLSLRQAMDRLFEDSFVRPRGFGFATLDSGALALDVTSTADALVVEAALPGVKPEEVDITVENGTLTIRATTASERRAGGDGQGEYLVHEIRRGEFARSLALPSGLEPDKANATFENGVLTLRIPRAEQVKPRQIRISPVTDGHQTAAPSAPSATDASGTEGSQG